MLPINAGELTEAAPRGFFQKQDGIEGAPIWSPDGSQILFTLNPTNDSFVHEPNGFYVVDADGNNLTLVIGGSGFKSSPEWWQ